VEWSGGEESRADLILAPSPSSTCTTVTRHAKVQSYARCELFVVLVPAKTEIYIDYCMAVSAGLYPV
jgi:hypothetical protein